MKLDIDQRLPDPQQPLTLAAAAAYLAQGGRRPHVATLARWCRRGVRGIKLRHGRLGAALVTTRRDLDQFARELAALDDTGPQPAPPRSPLQRDAAVTAAEARLLELGA
jgi:hypothetical protein